MHKLLIKLHIGGFVIVWNITIILRPISLKSAKITLNLHCGGIQLLFRFTKIQQDTEIIITRGITEQYKKL